VTEVGSSPNGRCCVAEGTVGELQFVFGYPVCVAVGNCLTGDLDTQQFGQVTWLLCGESVESDDCQFEVGTIFDWQPVQPCKNRRDVFMSMLAGNNVCK